MKKICLSFVVLLILIAISKFSFAITLTPNQKYHEGPGPVVQPGVQPILNPTKQPDKPKTDKPTKKDICSFSCALPDGATKAAFSVTSRAFFCIKNSLDVMLLRDCPKYNILKPLKEGLKPAIIAALTLFIILVGMQVATTGKVTKKDFFIVILKFAFVWYLAIDTGLSDLVYNGGLAAMTSLSNFVMEGSIDGKVCNYLISDYPEDYKYLAMWDKIDCKILQYLFIDAESLAGTGAVLTFGLLTIIIPLIFSVEIIFAIFFMIFTVFLIIIAASVFHFFVLALIGLALMTYFGVIFAPMMLFSYTKHFFDNWWKTTVSFILQPVVITIFIVIPFLLLDQVMYEDCAMKQQGKIWIVDILASPSDACKSSLGYQMSYMFSHSPLNTVSTIFVDLVKADSWKGKGNMLLALIKTVFFCYLFLLLTEKGGSLAAKLTSGPQIGKFAINAKQIMNQLMDRMTKKADEKKDGGDKKDNKKNDGKKNDGISASGKDSKGRSGVSVSGGKGSGGGGGISAAGK